MRPRYGWIALCLLLVNSLNSGVIAETATDQNADRAQPATTDDIQDLLLLGPTGPVRIRLHITVNGLGFRQVWRQTVEESFVRFDAAKKGAITSDQAMRLYALFQSDQPAQSLVANPLAAAAMLMKSKSSVTLEDVLVHLDKNAQPFSVRSRLASHGAGPALFSLIDTDGDGQLSREELNAAESSLRCRDFNDDGMITAEELVLGPSSTAPQADNAASASSPQVDGPIITVGPSTSSESLVDTLLFRYDRNHDGRLSFGAAPFEIHSVNNAFARFDANHDQSLDRTELLALVMAPPDIDLFFTFGRGMARSSTEDHSANADAAYRLRRKLDGGYRLSIGENEVDFRRNNRDPGQNNQGSQLSDYDQNKDGFLSGDELMAAGLKANLLLIDTNGDGRVSDDEFDAYMKWQSQITASRLVLEATDEGQDLFALLDINGDGFLSARELKNAAAILSTEDADHDGFLTPRDIPYRVLLELTRGGPAATNNNVVATTSSARQPRHNKSTAQPPDWFTKMDRNGDGDLTPEEFLGTRAQFDKLDANHDGLIDASEAAAASQGN